MIVAAAIFFIALCMVSIWIIEADDIEKQRWEQDYGYDLEDEFDETDGQLGEVDDWEFPFTENTAYSWEEVEESFGELYDNMEADNEQKEKSE